MLSRLAAHAVWPALALTVLPAGVSAAPAPEALTITAITTQNESGGLTPYLPLFTTIRVSFTDDSPSDPSAYRVDVVGEEYRGKVVGTARANPEQPGTFEATVDAYELPVGEALDFTVRELRGDRATSASAAESFTFTYVDHPRRFSTSSTREHGRWSYRAGRLAHLRFRGGWEEGTRFSTQVFVSRRKRFTARDFARNVRGDAALVRAYDRARPVLSFRIPRRLRGQYVWVSVLGEKPGEGGWRYTVGAEYVR